MTPKLYELVKTIADQRQVIATAYLDDVTANAMNDKLSKKTTARWICHQQQ